MQTNLHFYMHERAMTRNTGYRLQTQTQTYTQGNTHNKYTK